MLDLKELEREIHAQQAEAKPVRRTNFAPRTYSREKPRPQQVRPQRVSPPTDTGAAWPTAHGPRPALLKLGLINTIDEPLTWARNAGQHIHGNGQRVYTSRSTYLNKWALRCLAALSLEGFNVRLDGSESSEIHVRIVEPEEVTK